MRALLLAACLAVAFAAAPAATAEPAPALPLPADHGGTHCWGFACELVNQACRRLFGASCVG